MLLDPETLALVPGVERLLGPARAQDGALLVPRRDEHAGLRDRRTRRLAELRRLRRGRADAAAAAKVWPSPRLARIRSRTRRSRRSCRSRATSTMLEERTGRRGGSSSAALHVHVGMAELRALPRRARSDPAVAAGRAGALAQLAVSAAQGAGCRLSGRAGRLLELPRAGRRRLSPTRESVGAGDRGHRRLHEDLVGPRPHPAPGHARDPDRGPADRRLPVGRARSARAGALRRGRAAATPGDRDDYLDWRELAARGVAPVEELLRVVEPASRELGTWELVELLRERPRPIVSSRWVSRRGCRRSRPTSSRARLSRPWDDPVGAVRALARGRRLGRRSGARLSWSCSASPRVPRSSWAAGLGRSSPGPCARAGDRAHSGGLALGPRGLVRGARSRTASHSRPSTRVSGLAFAGVDLAPQTAVVLLRESTLAVCSRDSAASTELGRRVRLRSGRLPRECRPSAVRFCAFAARAGCLSRRGFGSWRWGGGTALPGPRG